MSNNLHLQPDFTINNQPFSKIVYHSIKVSNKLKTGDVNFVILKVQVIR